MTTHLYIAFTCNLDNTEELLQELESYVKAECFGKIPNGALENFRFKIQQDKNHFMVEPYFGASSFVAQFENKKHRPYVDEAMMVLVESLQMLSTEIEIVFCAEDCTERIVKDEQISSIESILSLRRVPFKSRFEITNHPIFFASQVEFELEKPIEVADENTAIGYFRNYYVCAENIQETLNFIIEFQKPDVLIGYGRVEEVLPILLPAESRDSFSVNQKGVFYSSGKVLYS
ncbi:MAG: hypothetical protein F6K00_02365 [Leptolyngbya sp. SIOISBB]|nr:hypothetical protein [Leptolyngbya sp. SIOISBB]